MRIGFFKRSGSYILDIVPIILLVTATLTWFVGDIIKSNTEDYDKLETMYNENLVVHTDIMSEYYNDYIDGNLTQDEYLEIESRLQDEFMHNNSYLIQVVIYNYWTTAVLYVIITINILYLAYNIVLKGNTLGRKLMGIELKGKVTWYNIILREFFWKHLFWTFTFSTGLAIDLGLIAFTKKKRALRDIFSKTYLAPMGVNYPF